MQQAISMDKNFFPRRCITLFAIETLRTELITTATLGSLDDKVQSFMFPFFSQRESGINSHEKPKNSQEENKSNEAKKAGGKNSNRWEPTWKSGDRSVMAE